MACCAASCQGVFDLRGKLVTGLVRPQVTISVHGHLERGVAHERLQALWLDPGNGPVNTGKQTSSVDLNYKPRHLNKVIELWEDGQPVYYTSWGVGPGTVPYEQGKKMCKTYADAINIEFEHGLFDLKDLREFMRGLKDGGGTRSGHRFPATFVTPAHSRAQTKPSMYANSWVIGQIWDAGVTGIHICHARDPKATAVAAHMVSRYLLSPCPRPGSRACAAPARVLRAASGA